MILYREIEGQPERSALEKIETLGGGVFGRIDAEKFASRIDAAVSLHTVLALSGEEIVGFKIGYAIDEGKFYSWLGGVEKNFRKRGIARELMRRQHAWCRENGFRTIQTKTRNNFKEMLILNLKNGFDIAEVYRDAQNQIKIVLEKKLV